MTDRPVRPVVLVDDGGWVEVPRRPEELRVEPRHDDEVVTAFDRRGHGSARAVEDRVVLVPDPEGA